MSSTVISKRLVSTEEYHKMGETGLLQPDENVELINGEILNICPIGSKHFAIVNKLNALFVKAFSDQFIVSVQNPVRIDQWNEPEPDLVLLKYKEAEYYQGIPYSEDVVAMIEVSHSTYDFDKNVKLPIYASSGIPVLWIVNVSEKRIEEYTTPKGDVFTARKLYMRGDEITLENISFDVSTILIKLEK